MTITVRNSSVTGATTVLRQLTYSEVDANWSHLASVSNASARNTEYDSTANFNVAQAALTATVGFKQVRIGTGNSDGIVFPSQGAAPYQTSVTYGLFNSVTDPQHITAYNYNRAVTTEPSLHWIKEGHYYDGSAHYMEENLDYVSSDGGTSKRFFGLTINRSTHLAVWAWSGNQLRFESSSNVGELLFEPSLGKITRSVSDGATTVPAISLALLNATSNAAAVSRAIQFGIGTVASAAAQIYAKRVSGNGGRLFFRSADSSGSLLDRFEINDVGHMIATGSGTEILLGTGSTVSAAGYSGFSASGTTGGLVDLRVNNTSEARFYANSSGGLFIQNSQGRSITLQTGDGTNAQVVIGNTASANRTLNLTGSNSGNPTISASGGVVAITGAPNVAGSTNTTAGGADAISFGTSAAIKILFGSGAPTAVAPQGSLYMRTDGSSTTTRMYVNTTGSSTWTNVSTAA